MPRYVPIAALALAGCLATGQSAARDLLVDAYLGAGVMPWAYDGAGENEEALGGRLIGGVMFTDYLGVEAHFGWLGEADSASGRSVELDSVDSVLVRLNRPLTPAVDAYALVGYTSVRMVIQPGAASDNDEAPSASGVSVGLGAQIRVAPDLSLGLDAMSYASEPDFDFQALAATLRWHF